jgi:hypothetical protein
MLGLKTFYRPFYRQSIGCYRPYYRPFYRPCYRLLSPCTTAPPYPPRPRGTAKRAFEGPAAPWAIRLISRPNPFVADNYTAHGAPLSY